MVEAYCFVRGEEGSSRNWLIKFVSIFYLLRCYCCFCLYCVGTPSSYLCRLSCPILAAAVLLLYCADAAETLAIKIENIWAFFHHSFFWNHPPPCYPILLHFLSFPPSSRLLFRHSYMFGPWLFAFDWVVGLSPVTHIILTFLDHFTPVMSYRYELGLVSMIEKDTTDSVRHRCKGAQEKKMESKK